VKASTASRILLWIVGVFGAFALILFAAGDEGAREAFGNFIILGVTFGGLAWLGYRYRVLPRRESFAGQARDLGLRAESGDPLGLVDRSFVLFRWMASVREVENTATGRRSGLEVVVADYWFSPTSAAERDDYERYTCVLTQASATWADLSVVPERLASRMCDVLALPDIGTESVEFDRRFEIRSADRRFASAFVDARMMAWLLEQLPGMGFEILGGWLMVFRPRATTSVDDLDRALDLHEAFLERIPRVVFPGRPDIG
jgi:hypothetical protein